MNHYSYPNLTKLNKIIIFISLGCFLLMSILNAVGAFSLVSFIGLSSSGLLSGFVWQLLTYPFMEGQLIGLIFNALLLWFVGSELEQLWGSKIYFRFLLFVSLLTGISYSLIQIIFFYGTSHFFVPLHGLTGLNMSILIAYSILYPDRQLSMMMIFPMRARTFCWILVGIEAYMAIFSSQKGSWAHLLAMAFGFMAVKLQNHLIIRKFFNFDWNMRKVSKTKSHLYVVPKSDDDENSKPKYWQ